MGSAGSAEPGGRSFDAIVIGAGIGGVTAGALLAGAGQRTLLVEAGSGPGGCVHAFQRGDYRIDPAVHLMIDPPMLQGLVDHLGVADQVTFLPASHFYRALGPGLSVPGPFGVDAFIDAQCAQFASAADDVRSFLLACHDLHVSLHEMGNRGALVDLEAMTKGHPLGPRLLKATLSEALDEYVSDPAARTILGLPGMYLGLPPSELSFRAYAQMLFAVVTHGAVSVAGGAEQLVGAIADSITSHGGELLYDRRVERILIEGGRACGVLLDDGQEIRAAAVVSNADALQTLEGMVGVEQLPPAYVKRLRRLPISDSVFTLFAATTLDLTRIPTASHQMFITYEQDLDAAYKSSMNGEPAFLVVAVPSLLEDGCAPDGQHLIMASTAAPYDPGRPWPEVKQHYVDGIVTLLDRALPGVAAALVFSEAATPVAIERFTRNPRGAIYAWGNSPAGTGSKPPDNVTPIPGLFLAGAWTAPGSGFSRALGSGWTAASEVLRAAGSTVELPRFKS